MNSLPVTPQEARREIHRMAYRDALARAVLDLGAIEGWSAEDTYSVLAFHALLERARYADQMLAMLAAMPSAPFSMSAEDAAARGIKTKGEPR